MWDNIHCEQKTEIKSKIRISYILVIWNLKFHFYSDLLFRFLGSMAALH